MQFSQRLAANIRIWVLVGLLAPAASAQIWDESLNGGGDAPGLPPGQVTAGVGPLVTINGALASPDFDPDMYCIRITDPANFSATTVGSTAVDLSLWLFDASFNGVAHDGADDGPFGPNAGYQASLSNQFVGSPGIYFLAVTRGGIDAPNGIPEIWLDIPTVENPPNGPGAPGPITGWTSPGYGLAGPYSIQLTGASYHVPEPAGTALGIGTFFGLLVWRRANAGRARRPVEP